MPEHRLPSWRVSHSQCEKFASVLRSGIASPWTTSMGRLFDAVASLAGLCSHASFEGQAAMAVQFAAEQGMETRGGINEGYPMELVPCENRGAKWMLDWRPMMSTMLNDIRKGSRPELVAARFHVGLADGVVRVAQVAGLPRVVLTGGCFQNRLLLSLVRHRLEAEGFTVYSHRLVPPNDGGLSLGQTVIAAHRLTGVR